MINKYQPVIGLEIHIELSTKSGMFCSCKNEHYMVPPNTNTCPVCLGLPGALPVPNAEAINWTIKMGHALNCKINNTSKFDRKHYNYPDLPKGYQISQYDMPFCVGGEMKLPISGKVIRIKRVHLEEDTGKLIHRIIDGKKVSLVDYNRSGSPLLEIVTEPDFANASETSEFAKELQLIARYLEISDCDMDKGSMRLEVNISLRKTGTTALPDYKVEVKNINSFKFSEKAIEYEMIRQSKILEGGETPKQETRGWDEGKNATVSQRFKESADDYRYFPEPDIPPIVLSDKHINKIKDSLPELPPSKRVKLRKLNLPNQYIEVLTNDLQLGRYYEISLKLGAEYKISALTIAKVIVNQKLHNNFPEPAGLIKHLLALQKTNYTSIAEVNVACEKVIDQNQEVVKSYKAGKVQVIGYLIGQVQKILNGKGDPKEIKESLEKHLRN